MEIKRNKKIIFKQENEQKIKIILKYETFDENRKIVQKEKQIGQIFSPSGSGGIYTNAIQVCGFDKAFEFWGCGLFAKPKIRIEGDNRYEKRFFYDEKGKPIMEQVKDIQLYFDENTQYHETKDINDCHICYNSPCTCEIKGQGYTIKRSDDIKHKLETVKKKKQKLKLKKNIKKLIKQENKKK